MSWWDRWRRGARRGDELALRCANVLLIRVVDDGLDGVEVRHGPGAATLRLRRGADWEEVAPFDLAAEVLVRADEDERDGFAAEPWDDAAVVRGVLARYEQMAALEAPGRDAGTLDVRIGGVDLDMEVRRERDGDATRLRLDVRRRTSRA